MLPTDGQEQSECSVLDPACVATQGAENILGQALSDRLDEIGRAISQAVGQMVGDMWSAWIKFPTPDMIKSDGDGSAVNPAPARPGYAGLETVLEWVAWTSLGICVLSLMAAGAMIALRARRGEGGEHLSKIAIILVAAVLIGAASAIARAVLSAGPPANAAPPVLMVQENLWWYVGAAVVLSIVVGAAKLAWEQRAAAGWDLARSLITLVVVTGAGLSVINFCTQAADGFAKALVEDAADGDFGARVLTLLGMNVNQAPGFGSLLVIFLGSIAMLLSLVQILLLLIRDGMLVLLAAVLPLMASFTNTEMGQTWFKKTCAWLVAFILYKPAAAIVYAVAFEMVKVDDSSNATVLSVVTGLAMMAMALVAMPALMKFVIPMASLSGGGAAAGAIAGVAGAVGGAVGGQVASGAVKKAQSAGESETDASGLGGGGGGGGPTGSAPASPQGGGESSDQGSGTEPEGGPDGGESGEGKPPLPTSESPGHDSPPELGPAEGAGEAGGSTAEAAGGAGAAAGAVPALAAAEKAKEVGDEIKAGAEGTVNEGLEGPDDV